jgi:hypothetical protein
VKLYTVHLYEAPHTLCHVVRKTLIQFVWISHRRMNIILCNKHATKTTVANHGCLLEHYGWFRENFSADYMPLIVKRTDIVRRLYPHSNSSNFCSASGTFNIPSQAFWHRMTFIFAFSFTSILIQHVGKRWSESAVSPTRICEWVN